MYLIIFSHSGPALPFSVDHHNIQTGFDCLGLQPGSLINPLFEDFCQFFDFAGMKHFTSRKLYITSKSHFWENHLVRLGDVQFAHNLCLHTVWARIGQNNDEIYMTWTWGHLFCNTILLVTVSANKIWLASWLQVSFAVLIWLWLNYSISS